MRCNGQAQLVPWELRRTIRARNVGCGSACSRIKPRFTKHCSCPRVGKRSNEGGTITQRAASEGHKGHRGQQTADSRRQQNSVGMDVTASRGDAWGRSTQCTRIIDCSSAGGGRFQWAQVTPDAGAHSLDLSAFSHATLGPGIIALARASPDAAQERVPQPCTSHKAKKKGGGPPDRPTSHPPKCNLCLENKRVHPETCLLHLRIVVPRLPFSSMWGSFQRRYRFGSNFSSLRVGLNRYGFNSASRSKSIARYHTAPWHV
jgi:hypothetical protein